MQGYLFDDYLVNIVPKSVELGGAWQGPPRNGHPVAWDPDSLRFFYERMYACGAGAVVLDIGANTGSFCLIPATRGGCFVVFAFEPQDVVFNVLRNNIALNDLEGITTPYKVALSDKAGPAVLKIPGGSGVSGLATLSPDSPWLKSYKSMNIATVVFDDTFNLHRLDLIKVDTEGHDVNVLRGMRRHLDKFSPGILFENWPKDQAMHYLTRIGYRSFSRVGKDNWFVEKRG